MHQYRIATLIRGIGIRPRLQQSVDGTEATCPGCKHQRSHAVVVRRIDGRTPADQQLDGFRFARLRGSRQRATAEGIV